MSEPTMPQKSPYVLELEPGEYWWCSCGKSSNQPFCDGAHKDTDFSPVSFELKEKTTVALCGCKKSGGTPFCDGAHSDL